MVRALALLATAAVLCHFSSVANAGPLEITLVQKQGVEQNFAGFVRRAYQVTAAGDWAPGARESARVSVARPACNVTVAKTGPANYRTVQAAINGIPGNRGTKLWIICVKAGVYKEKVRVPSTATYVQMWGWSLDPNKVEITWGDTAGTRGPGGSPLGTYNSYTFAVEADYFSAYYMMIRNTAPRPADGAVGGQAVAARLTANYVSFFRCHFTGYQDTLYCHQGIHYFKNCYVRGSVDFIFGNGTVLFLKCQLYADVVTKGYLTAQNQAKPSEGTGFVIREGAISGTGLVYLGRAWGLASRVVFAKVFMSKIIAPVGWDNWGKPTDAIFYGEYKCYGSGAEEGRRASWAFQLTDAQARPFMSSNWIKARTWMPAAGIIPAALP
ncbi:hypothetical protein CBR_g20437 [Chara braunii]|uniref:Pectinesterase n=1 Tax=Chara braunii TaxID=69332 RepID=A0A388JUC2_CHABU|nr:hypothetical protein CBR_g20437 [Chara braunii]|eukprot:GBG61406.1 hypothetical protein CBR_g20437 [Chara braunii]